MKKTILLLLLILNYGGEYIIAKNLLDDGTIKDYIPTIIPPSHEAYKFSTFGNIPLNGSTGGFNYSIPLYTIQDKDITYPACYGRIFQSTFFPDLCRKNDLWQQRVKTSAVH